MAVVPVAVAWSGGKDSALTLAALQADPDYHVVALVTTVTAGYDRVSIHGIRRSLLVAQAAALGLPVFEASIPPNSANDTYEGAFHESLRQVQSVYPGVRHVAFGDLFLADVRAYREALLPRLGWRGVFPLWGRDTAILAGEFIAAGFKAILCCVDTTQLNANFSGRAFDRQLIADLPPGVDPCGERGEFHTCVYEGPLFRRGLRLRRGVQVLRDERFQYCDLLLEDDGSANGAVT